MGKATGIRAGILGLWLVMVAFDPTGTYRSAPMIGSTLLPLLLFLDMGRSPWLDWQGALPVDRLAWLRREFAKVYGEQVVLQGLFWALVALIKAGPGGWAAYGTANLGAIVAGLAAAPWFVAQGLHPGPSSWSVFLPWRGATALATVVAVAALGVWWEDSPGWFPLTVIGLVCGASFAVARFRARRLLLRGDQG